MSVSKNNTMVSSNHISKPNIALSRSPTSPGLIGSERYAIWNFLPTLPYTSVAYMLIVVTILLALAILAIVYKHVAKPSSQQLSEKFRLYMAGSIVGDFIRWIFNDLGTRSRQDTVVVSNKDEKSRRLSLDMSSSSSTSLSPSVLQTHDVSSPRLYKKSSNFRLTSHRRSSSRQKTQSQNVLANSHSSIENNPSFTSSSNDSHSEQSSTSIEQDETKTSVTIHVAETLNSRIDPSSVDICQESSKREIDKIGNSRNQNSSNTVELTNGKSKTDQHLIQDENTDSWTESQQTPTVISNRYDKIGRLVADLTFSEPSISPMNNGSPKLQKKNSWKGSRKQDTRNKEQTTQESDGEIDSIISDDHSDSLIQQIDTTVPTTQKHDTQEETFVKTGHKRRRRRTRGSKNHQQKAQQNQQTQNSDQRSLKQEQPISSQKQDVSQQSASDVSKSRNVSGKIKSKSYYFFHNALCDQNTYSKQHHSNEIPKSHQAVEKSKTAYFDIWERHPHQQHAESHQPSRSDQTGYFLQTNKRGSQTYQATLPESNRKVAVFPRTDMPNVASPSHASTASHNFSSTSALNVPVTYADVIAPHNRPSTLSRPNTSGLPNGNNITTPAPAASVNNTTNYQWYSPFGSGLSIQLTPPASPQNIHRHLPSTNSNTPNSVLLTKQSQDRNRSVIAPPPSFSASNNVPSYSPSSSSSLSMFSSPSFSPSLSNALSNHNQSNIITLSTNSSFRESLFGRKHPVQDQEKGELSDEADDSESWNKKMGISELSNQKSWVRQNDDALSVRKGKFGEGTKKAENVNENVWHRDQEPQQQFSLFDSRLSFMYPPKS